MDEVVGGGEEQLARHATHRRTAVRVHHGRDPDDPGDPLGDDRRRGDRAGDAADGRMWAATATVITMTAISPAGLRPMADVGVAEKLPAGQYPAAMDGHRRRDPRAAFVLDAVKATVRGGVGTLRERPRRLEARPAVAGVLPARPAVPPPRPAARRDRSAEPVRCGRRSTRRSGTPR
ncbi:hypothetical protein [Streptomyces cinereospinus]|uniref:Uncharacterized protein n=1 Tax=Streptomyces cinereospinus TaxID=285561 RepID=A0ABV5N5E9_9ACTN